MKRILALLSLCLLAPAMFAAPNFFTPAQNDQSMYLLGSLFGNVGNVLTGWGSSPLLMNTFYYFNQAVLVLGCIVIVYTLIVSTVNTSHHGEMMGQKWNSVWIPMRTAIGFALLLPIGAGKTYAVVQAMVMWVIVQGVGAADYLWSNMVDQVVSGDTSFQPDTASSTTAANTIMVAFQYYVCTMQLVQMQTIQKYRTQNNGFGPTQWDDNTSPWKNNNNYGWDAPGIFFTTSTALAATPNTNFWTFGIANPSGWANQSLCGTISSPAAPKGSNPALITYYNNQAAILNMALGAAQSSAGSIPEELLGSDGQPLLLAHSTTFSVQGTSPTFISFGKGAANSWGRYGGNWLGDYGGSSQPGKSSGTPDSRAGISSTDSNSETNPPSGSPQLNGRFRGLQIMLPYIDTSTGKYARDSTTGKLLYQKNYLPTVAYLAELLSQNIDAGSPTSTPTAEVSTNSIGSSSEGKGGVYVIASSSQVPQYVTQQLALIAQAYTDATAANYAAYQNAISGGDNVPQAGSKIAAGAAAAKFNGWASAGAFYLNMAKILQATTADIVATDDYSYGSLACTTGIGPSKEASDNGMLCKDARSPADVGGVRRDFNSNNKPKSNSTQLGDAITQAQDVTNQATGAILDFYGNDDNSESDIPGPCQDTQNTSNPPPGPITPGGQTTTPGYIYNGTGYYYNANDPNNPYRQKCGLYNSTGYGAFSTSNFTKPKFPKMIINPLGWYKYVNGMMIYNFSQTLAPMLQMGQASTMQNPILTLRQSGIRLLNTSAALYHAGLNYMWISGLVSYVASNWSPIAGAAFSTFNWAASMATAMVGAMMAMGAILAYYFPMIPYLVFTFATIQWLILTVEAMTAAPLMALGILHPEGNHEVFGHSSMGIAILSTVFLRPSLMIVGYFAATLMCYVVVLLINAGFFFAAGSMMTGDTSTGSVFGCVVVWMMYLNMVMVAINKAFSLIYHIPDHVTRWIGIHEPGGGDVEQMMGKVQEGAKQGGDLGKGGMDSAANARMGSAATAGQQRSASPKKKEKKKEGGDDKAEK